VALMLHEVGFAFARRRRPESLSLRARLSRVVAEHRVLAAFYVSAALWSAVVEANGSLGDFVGNYATPFGGDLLPSGLWHSAAAHFGHVAVGAGVLPVALAASWTLTALVHPERKEGHAFASLVVVLVPLLTFEVTSFDLRFTPDQFVQDRYLVYLVPLFAVGGAAWLAQRTQPTLRLVSLVAAGVAVGALVGTVAYDDRTVIFWAAPAAAFHPALETFAGSLGLTAGVLLALTATLLSLTLAVVARFAPTTALIGTAVAVAGFGAFEAGYVLDHAEPAMTRPPAAPTRDWIDEAVPGGRSVTLVPSPRDDASPWWEAELWNKEVTRVLRLGSGTTFTPFPADRVSIDYATGTIRGSMPSEYVVVSSNEVRFHLLAAAQIARGGPLRLLRARPPYRLSWATRNVTPDAWTRPHLLSAVRLYGDGRPSQRTIVLTLAAPRSAQAPVDFVLRSTAEVVRGRVDPGGARPPVRLKVCVPAHGYADATLVSSGDARIADGRFVALHVEQLRVDEAPRPRGGRAVDLCKDS
jgi:hypothetical protein